MRRCVTESQGDTAALVDRYFAPTLLVGSILLLQYHSIEFWTEHVGPLGWGWSVLLEAGALYLWYRRSLGLRVIGLFVSAMLLAGPLYTVAEPLLDRNHSELQTAAQREQRAGVLREEIAVLERQLNTFLENSKDRIGWAGRIDDARSQISERMKELRQVESTTDTAALNWKRQAVIIMQSVALLLYQFFSVLAVTTLSRRHAEELAQDSDAVARGVDDGNASGNTHDPNDNTGVTKAVTPVATPLEASDDADSEQEHGVAADNGSRVTVCAEEGVGAEVVGNTEMPGNTEIDKPVTDTNDLPASGGNTETPSATTKSLSKKVNGNNGHEGRANRSEISVDAPLAVVPESEDEEEELPDEIVLLISEALAGHLERMNLSQRAFAKEHGYTAADITRVKNHASYRKEGRRTASYSTLRRLGKQLGVLTPEEARAS